MSCPQHLSLAGKEGFTEVVTPLFLVFTGFMRVQHFAVLIYPRE